ETCQPSPNDVTSRILRARSGSRTTLPSRRGYYGSFTVSTTGRSRSSSIVTPSTSGDTSCTLSSIMPDSILAGKETVSKGSNNHASLFPNLHTHRAEVQSDTINILIRIAAYQFYNKDRL